MTETRTSNSNVGGLDEIDQKILDALRQDGRTPFAQIADQLSVSPGMIRTTKKTSVTSTKSMGKVNSTLVTIYARKVFILYPTRKRGSGGPGHYQSLVTTRHGVHQTRHPTRSADA